MYVKFFGLQQNPFSIAPDPRYLFMSERHREALAHLLYGVAGGGGFVLLTGEIGAGKTTVCRCLLEQVPATCQVAYVFNPKLNACELLQSVCEEFGVAVPAVGDAKASGATPATVKHYIDPLNTHLLAAHAQGRQCVLIIDEAQNLSAEVLEQLRLLTNLETNERKLLQIILIGQPELRSLLAAPALESLAQRVIARYHLGALTAAETAGYVAHRLSVAGHCGVLPFDARALRRIHTLTAGVPRRINRLCDRALLGAYSQGQAAVRRRLVDQAAAEVFEAGAASPSGGRWRLAGAAAAGLVVGSVLAAAVLDGPWGRRATAVSGAGGAASMAAPPASAGSAGPLWVAAVPASAASGASISASAPAVASSASVPVVGLSGGPSQATALATGALVAATGAGAPASAADLAASADGKAGGANLTLAPARPRPQALSLGSSLAVFPRDEQAAWRELADQWALQTLASGDVCQQVRAQHVRCYRTANSNLAQLRRLDRPGLLALRGGDGVVRYARLVGLSAQQVELASGAQNFSLPMAAFSALWHGEFSTFWRAPEGYVSLLDPGARGLAVDALAVGLADLLQTAPPAPGQVLAGTLAARVVGFQRAWGLHADGVVGPTTFMQLNRARGVLEPRLGVDLPER